jgi:hypothetical protein
MKIGACAVIAACLNSVTLLTSFLQLKVTITSQDNMIEC